jgi:ribosomal-protein-alanine N-acetyltransferase
LGLARSTLASKGRWLPRLGGWLEITMTGADGAGINECKESGAPAGPAGPRAPLTPVSLGPAELQACLDLDRLCLGGLWSARQWRTELADPLRVGLGLMQAGRLLAIACAWLIVDELHITLVAVDPAHRRRGLAQGLLRALLQRGRELGAARATLEVGSGNPAGLALYRAVGFRTTGVRRGYYSNGDDALIQWLELE